VLNHKFNSRSSIRTGMYLNRYMYNLYERYLDHETNTIKEPINVKSDASTVQLFSQWNYRAAENLTFNYGLHFLYMPGNGSKSLEPRASIKYDLDDQQSLTLGYGLHSQIQPIGVYEAQVQQSDGTFLKPNTNVGFNKAQHLVLGYGR